jgi:hypothetical protein
MFLVEDFNVIFSDNQYKCAERKTWNIR